MAEASGFEPYEHRLDTTTQHNPLPLFSSPGPQPHPQSHPTTFGPIASIPLSFGINDHPDAHVTTIRDSLHTLVAYIEDRAAATARARGSPEDVEVFWSPLAARISRLVTSWNGSMTRLQQPQLRIQAGPACERPHNPPCDREHNLPCTRAHADQVASGKHSQTAIPKGGAPCAQPGLPPIPAKTFAAIAARKVISREHIDLANDIRTKVANMPAEAALRMATESAPRAPPAKAKPRSMPKGANRTIFVPLQTLSAQEKAKLPQAGTIADAFNSKFQFGPEAIVHEWCVATHGDAMDDDGEDSCRGSHTFDVPGLAHVEVLPASIRFVFDEPIPSRELFEELHEFLTAVCRDTVQTFPNLINKEASNAIVADTFHFKSTVVFSNVLPIDATGTRVTNDGLRASLADSPVWEEITVTRAHFWQPPSNGPDSAGCLFVDFHDDRHGSNRRRVTRLRTRIGADFLTCREAKPSAKPRTAPQCSLCLRWGHLAARCSSQFSNCAVCAGAHRENMHSSLAPAAPIRCFNCGGGHRADSTECRFHEKRTDRKWIFDNAPKFDRAKGAWTYYNTRKGGETRTSSRA